MQSPKTNFYPSSRETVKRRMFTDMSIRGHTDLRASNMHQLVTSYRHGNASGGLANAVNRPQYFISWQPHVLLEE